MLILLLFAFIFPVVGQEIDSVKTTTNQLNLDVHLLGLGLTIHQPINEKYAFTYGVQGGFIINYAPIYYVYYGEITKGLLLTNSGYVKKFGIHFGATSYSKQWTNSVVLNFGFPFVGADDLENARSPYGGLSFQTFYKISPTSSLGTNIDFSLIIIERGHVLYLSTSFITYRIEIGEK